MHAIGNKKTVYQNEETNSSIFLKSKSWNKFRSSLRINFTEMNFSFDLVIMSIKWYGGLWWFEKLEVFEI